MDGFVKAGLIVAGILLLLISPFLILGELLGISEYYDCPLPMDCNVQVFQQMILMGMLASAITIGGIFSLIVGIKTPETLKPKTK